MNSQHNHAGVTLRWMLSSALGVALLLLITPARAAAKDRHGISSIDVSITDGQKFLVLGEETTLAKLPAKLKAAGATEVTTVRVAVEKNTPEVTMKAIAGKLSSEGYRRILFTRPRHAEAIVASNAPSLPPPLSTPR